MKQGIFSVFDSVAAQYIDPFTAPTMEFAIRGFGEACANPESPFAKHPEDFALFQIGEWDGELGVITPCEGAKISKASDFSGGFGNQIPIELEA